MLFTVMPNVIGVKRKFAKNKPDFSTLKIYLLVQGVIFFGEVRRKS
jgi:hypothetical protein